MKILLKILTIISLAMFIYACSDSDSSTENSGSTITIDDANLTFDSTEITRGDAVSLTYDLGGDEISATINWDDGHVIVISGSGTVRHGTIFL